MIFLETSKFESIQHEDRRIEPISRNQIHLMCSRIHQRINIDKLFAFAALFEYNNQPCHTSDVLTKRYKSQRIDSSTMSGSLSLNRGSGSKALSGMNKTTFSILISLSSSDSGMARLYHQAMQSSTCLVSISMRIGN